LEDYRGDRPDRPHAQRLVVYALILVLMAILVVVILLAIGNQIANLFTNIVAALK
jgi:Flp pilus assembly pilin Flp